MTFPHRWDCFKAYPGYPLNTETKRRQRVRKQERETEDRQAREREGGGGGEIGRRERKSE